ncbi:hypothetical protein NA56DRAFT_675740 [Hyaloscypha hepaticicola]|uniref:Uncharacterized protein n=1 Tax=Hyaloscypha hepaticicola TaxID=2082293 RepID=A0A2J6QQZ6_9HELO|nr:hypothetical protein NA56DRAFT_675740 [Hyaloscypha hepaticicola]
MDFDLPDAKRVRRSDLYTSRSPSSSPGPAADPTLESALHSRLAALYGPIPIPSTDPAPSNPTRTPKASASADADVQPEQENPQESQEEPHEFEFRLFSAPKYSNDNDIQAQKIILASPSSEHGDGGFVTRERDRRFYIAEPATGERKQRFVFAAVSGEEVLNLARRRAWGLEVPWRVKAIRYGQGEVLIQVHPSEKGKRKPGKKRRIVLRERQRKVVQREEAKKRERERGEEAEREKRTRRNRVKKVKRKMKEKALKAGVSAGASGSGSE